LWAGFFAWVEAQHATVSPIRISCAEFLLDDRHSEKVADLGNETRQLMSAVRQLRKYSATLSQARGLAVEGCLRISALI
jgi:hypothetical protein